MEAGAPLNAFAPTLFLRQRALEVVLLLTCFSVTLSIVVTYLLTWAIYGDVTPRDVFLAAIVPMLMTWPIALLAITVIHRLTVTQRRLQEEITERERVEGDMIDAKESAEQANRSKSEFLAKMSHELRTPLNAIIGFSTIIGNRMLGPVGSEKYLEYAMDIRRSGEHLLGLINEILDLAKIEAGKLELEESDVDIVAAAEACLSLVKDAAQEKGLQLRSRLPARLPLVRADERKLKQIMLNVLSNAVKFTPERGDVILEIERRGDGPIEISVIDSGIGMSAESIVLAFEPFAQVENGANRQYEGTGLGLPISKALAELHGGTITVKSEIGAGTSVTISLPAERIASAADFEASELA